MVKMDTQYSCVYNDMLIYFYVLKVHKINTKKYSTVLLENL